MGYPGMDLQLGGVFVKRGIPDASVFNGDRPAWSFSLGTIRPESATSHKSDATAAESAPDDGNPRRDAHYEVGRCPVSAGRSESGHGARVQSGDAVATRPDPARGKGG